MLLRDERQAALNRVETLCINSADDYASAATQTDDAALAALFEQLGQERRGMAEALAPHIRALGDLPQDPDPDREALDHVVVGLKALLSGDGGATLVEHRLRAEDALREAVLAAQDADLPEHTHAALAGMLAGIDRARARLLEIRA